MVGVNTSAAKFHHLITQLLVRREIKLARAVIAKMPGSSSAALQPVCSDNAAGAPFFDDDVVANSIELVLVFTGGKSRVEPFLQLKIENPKTKAVSRAALFFRCGYIGAIRCGHCLPGQRNRHFTGDSCGRSHRCGLTNGTAACFPRSRRIHWSLSAPTHSHASQI